ncbi:MAG: DUF2076 family protein [Betaproteobacteria bacterium]|nr:DUF2076 family protein [Betaproteobacteria bacterium]
MTSQETELLNTFLAQLTEIRGIAKDRAADDLIAKAVAQQPDSAYLLVQRSLLQDQALDAARQQIAKLESDLRGVAAPAAARSGGFLSGMSAWGRKPTAAVAPAFASQPSQASSPYAAATPSAMQQGGGSSFLGRAAATAAGVVGGAFLFQGISQLMGHHGNGTPASAQQGTPAESGLLTNSFANDVEPNVAGNDGMEQYDSALDDSAGFDDSSSEA